MNNRFKCLAFGLVLLCTAFTTIFAQQAADKRILLQGSYYRSFEVAGWYNIVAQNAASFGASKIDMIWMPPPSKSNAPNGYLPTQLYNFNNNFGSEAEHRAALTALKNANVRPIADVVVNHRDGDGSCWTFKNPDWPTYFTVSDDPARNIPQCNPIPQLSINADTGYRYDAARNLDHKNPQVREAVVAYLNKLKEFGYEGWRYDIAHGFSAEYLKEYNNRTSPIFSVGENWNGKQTIQNWINDLKTNGTNANSTAFDFSTFDALKWAVKTGDYAALRFEGKPSGGIGWEPRYYSTFVENHDTDDPKYCGDKCGVYNSGNVMQGYAYVLTHPGVPTLYWKHYMDWGLRGQIDNLINIRKGFGIHSESSVSIIRAEQGLYAAVIDGKVAMKIGGTDWSPQAAGLGSDWSLSTAGGNYAIWTKGGCVSNCGSLTVHFKKPAAWGEPNVYGWNGVVMAWPGVKMVAEGNGWYKATLNSTSANVVFNDGTNKTSDQIGRAKEGWFSPNATASSGVLWDGVWSDVKPDDVIPITAYRVYFKKPSAWAATVKVYTWNCSTTTAVWPGKDMIADATNPGWAYYDLGGSCNVIFNDGNGKQTVDLTRSATGWFSPDSSPSPIKWSGVWSDTKPDNPSPTTFAVFFNKPTAWAGAKIHYWGGTGCTASTWPGPNMIPPTGGTSTWLKFDLPSQCTNIVFNDGSGKQTVDLSRSSAGYFTTTGTNSQGKWIGNWSNTAKTTDIDVAEMPESVSLHDSYPNPFTQTTTLSFSLNEAQDAKLTVFGLTGQVVGVLTQGTHEAGTHRYLFDGTNLASGVYFYRLETGNGKILTGKMNLIK